jgi:hypothetical protein
MTDSRVSGACLCGAIRFEIETPTLFCGHCHCSMCQRNHGAGYVTWIAVPRDRLKILAGSEVLRPYISSSHGKRSFCERCGTSLFCEVDEHPDQVDIPLANLQGPIDRAPNVHIFFDDRADWVEVSDGLPRLGGATGMEPIEPGSD